MSEQIVADEELLRIAECVSELVESMEREEALRAANMIRAEGLLSSEERAFVDKRLKHGMKASQIAHDMLLNGVGNRPVIVIEAYILLSSKEQ